MGSSRAPPSGGRAHRLPTAPARHLSRELEELRERCRRCLPCDRNQFDLRCAYLHRRRAIPPPAETPACASTSTSRRRSSRATGCRSASSQVVRRAAEARAAAAEIGGPVVLKSQVLSGGRMKAGAVRFADTPGRGGAALRRDPADRGERPAPRCVLVEEKCGGRAGVLRCRSPGTAARKRPVVLFSDMGGIDIEEVAEKPPRPRLEDALLDDPAAHAAHREGGGRRGRRLRRRARTAHSDRLRADADLPRLRPDAGRDQPAGAARGRALRRARRPRRHGGRGARQARGAARPSSASATTRRARRGRRRRSRSRGAQVERGRPPRRRRQRRRVRRQPRAS